MYPGDALGSGGQTESKAKGMGELAWEEKAEWKEKRSGDSRGESRQVRGKGGGRVSQRPSGKGGRAFWGRQWLLSAATGDRLEGLRNRSPRVEVRNLQGQGEVLSALRGGQNGRLKSGI